MAVSLFLAASSGEAAIVPTRGSLERYLMLQLHSVNE